MSSETVFKCDCCGREIVSKATRNGWQGWCLHQRSGTEDIEATTDLYKELRGPHICRWCVLKITEAEEF